MSKEFGRDEDAWLFRTVSIGGFVFFSIIVIMVITMLGG